MSHTPKLTLIGLLNYDENIFSNVELPDGVEKQIFIDSLLLRHGEQPLINPNPDYLKLAFGAWSRKWYSNFERMIDALAMEYNPLYNYDRNEETEDTEKVTTAGETTGETSGTVENTVSAFNSTTYQPDEKSISGGNTSGTSASDTDRTYLHKAHLYGNIGVTTSVDMLLQEIGARKANNIYDILSEIFAEEFIIPVY